MTRKPKPQPLTSENALERIAARRAPNERETAAMTAAKAAQDQRPARARVALAKLYNGKLEVGPEHNAEGWSALLKETLGTRSNSFSEVILEQVELACRDRGHREPSAQVDNYALAIFGAIDPQDEWEALMAANIIGSHTMAMEMLGKARHADTREGLGFYVAQHSKLTKSVRTLTETLNKHRSGGKQQVIVRHVYINGNAVVGDGAQAVFGQLNGGGTAGQLAAQSHATAVAGVLGPPVWSEDEAIDALSVASSSRKAPVSDARGHEPGRAEGDG